MSQFIAKISKELNITIAQVESVLNLSNEDNTVHFIARYRKERTGNLDENYIRKIIDLDKFYTKLAEAKESVISKIDEQGLLTEKIKAAILSATTISLVEDIYTPFKKKRKTKADIAKEKGFEVVVNNIIYDKLSRNHIPQSLLTNYSLDDILAGASDILISDIVEDISNRDRIRRNYNIYGTISSKFKKDITNSTDEKVKKNLHKFKIYEEFTISQKRLKSYQVLALNRGEDLIILNVKLDKDKEFYTKFHNRLNNNDFELYGKCIREGYNKIFDSIEREIRKELTKKAEIDSLKTFQSNLKNLLMLKPHYEVNGILAIDPGYRTGCKTAIIDRFGKPIKFSKFYIHDLKRDTKAIDKIFSSEKDSFEKIVIGNGTGNKETVEFFATYLVKNKIENIEIITVNESGASVYSASDAGQEEFGDLDLTDRGTISIGRRYIDSLSELVKIPVDSIGVGMYQHDINKKLLLEKLSETVEDVVNFVGINVNTASYYLLSYVSGLDKRSAKKIVANSPYKTRKDLKKVLTVNGFTQAAGFLTISDSTEFLDRTFIHPEQYGIAKILLDNKKDLSEIEETEIENFYSKYKNDLKALYPDTNIQVIKDIVTFYNSAGKELRKFEGTLKKETISDKLGTAKELVEGQKIKGIIRNITPFGAFVDIGQKNDGLIHISQIADTFVKDPHDFLIIGQEVQVKVIKIDVNTGKISLSSKK